MGIAWTILSSFAIAAGAVGTLMLLTLGLAGGANSTPAQIRMLKRFMLATALGGAGCFAGGIWILYKGFPGYAGLVGALPLIVVVVGMIWLTIRTGR